MMDVRPWRSKLSELRSACLCEWSTIPTQARSGMDSSDNKDDDSVSSSSRKRPHAELASAASAPQIQGSMVVFSLAPLSPHLTCRLCSGYFRDPVTITECLHTFCKSCLYYAFSTGYSQCPTCKVDLGTYPFRATLADRTLQELVDKVLFPELKVQDAEKEKEFYAKKGIELKDEFRDAEQQRKSRRIEAEYEEDEAGPAKGETTKVSMLDDDLDFSLTPETEVAQSHEMPPLERPWLRTSGRIKIVQLKKYLLKKLNMESTETRAVELLCNGIIAGNELSLTFVNRTMWVDVLNNLELTYRRTEEF